MSVHISAYLYPRNPHPIKEQDEKEEKSNQNFEDPNENT